MAETKKNTRLNNIIKDLSSTDEKKVFTAVKQLRKHGKKDAMLPIAKLLCSTTNEELKNEIKSLLFDLKDQSVVEELINIIQSDEFESEKALLVSIFWQSSLDGSDYLADFIQQAIKGNYFVGIEVLSVIDNFDATFQGSEIEEIKFDLDEAINSEETEKAKLLVSISAAIDSLNIEF